MSVSDLIEAVEVEGFGGGGVVAPAFGDVLVAGVFDSRDDGGADGGQVGGPAAGTAGGGVFGERGVPDVLRGSRPGRTGRLFGSSRSAIDQHRVVTPQVLRQASRPETASVRAAATTSTTPTEVCCRSSPPGAWCNVVRQAGDPRRTDMVQHLDLPVAAYPGGELGRGGLAGGQAGDGVDGLGGTISSSRSAGGGG